MGQEPRPDYSYHSLQCLVEHYYKHMVIMKIHVQPITNSRSSTESCHTAYVLDRQWATENATFVYLSGFSNSYPDMTLQHVWVQADLGLARIVSIHLICSAIPYHSIHSCRRKFANIPVVPLQTVLECHLPEGPELPWMHLQDFQSPQTHSLWGNRISFTTLISYSTSWYILVYTGKTCSNRKIGTPHS